MNLSRSEKAYWAVQRAAEIRAGIQGYTGHLSNAELARRIETYNRIMEEIEKGRAKP